MALTTCPDCQGPLSDTAPTCQKCGWTRPAIKKPLVSHNMKGILILVALALGVFAVKLGIDYLAAKDAGREFKPW